MTPEPATTEAWLESAGVPEITLHRFSHLAPGVVPGPRGEAWLFVFRCTISGEERVWGLANRTLDDTARFG